jgi:hypothetical protein
MADHLRFKIDRHKSESAGKDVGSKEEKIIAT